MKRKVKETTEQIFHNHTIMTDKKRKMSCNIKILNEIEKQFEYADKTKSKVFFMRYDIRFPEGYDHADNSIFREFQSKFMKNLSRQGLDPGNIRPERTVLSEQEMLEWAFEMFVRDPQRPLTHEAGGMVD